MSTQPTLYLGGARRLDGQGPPVPLRLPAHHLVTHGVVVGMTGSGKSGLVTVIAEEALRNRVPVLIIDVKGDLPNLLLAFPSFAAEPLLPWARTFASKKDERTPEAIALALAEQRRQELTSWGFGEEHLARYTATTHLRVLTPGSGGGERVHVLSALERRSPRWDVDPEAARASLSAAVSLVLRLVGKNPDPAKSGEHVLLSVLAERRLRDGQPAALEGLVADVIDPPCPRIGELTINDFLSKAKRKSLASALNNLLASTTFSAWRSGASLDVGEWLAPVDRRAPAVVLSVAHLDDEERALVLGVLLEEVLSWVRTQPGSQELRALLLFDEVYGFLPPHPANPPTKRPLVALMKQARAFGVGVVVATQNPMDLDYRALSNAGVWCVGRLQTDADRERVVEGLRHSDGSNSLTDIAATIPRLAPRWFVMRNAHDSEGPRLFQPRWALSLLRGPMTADELRRARATVEQREHSEGAPPPSILPVQAGLGAAESGVGG